MSTISISFVSPEWNRLSAAQQGMMRTLQAGAIYVIDYPRLRTMRALIRRGYASESRAMFFEITESGRALLDEFDAQQRVAREIMMAIRESMS